MSQADEDAYHKDVDFVKKPLEQSLEVPSHAKLKALSRTKSEQSKRINEIIHIRVLDPVTQKQQCQFAIARKNLSHDHLQTLIRHSPANHNPNDINNNNNNDNDHNHNNDNNHNEKKGGGGECTTFELAYIRDFDTGQVILPRDMRRLCQPKPSSYYVVKKSSCRVQDYCGGSHSHSNFHSNLIPSQSQSQSHHHASNMGDYYYQGDTKFILRNVPTSTQNGIHPVHKQDVQNWIIHCIVEDDNDVQKSNQQISQLSKQLQELAQTIKHMSGKPMYNDKGKQITGDKAWNEREIQFQDLSNQRDSVQLQYDAMLYQRDQMRLDKTKLIHFNLKTATTDTAITTSKPEEYSLDHTTWIFEFLGANKEYYEDIVLQKHDWNSISMHVNPIHSTTGNTTITTTTNAMKDEPQNSTSDANFLVDMSGIVLQRIKDGYGVQFTIHNMHDKNKHENHKDTPSNVSRRLQMQPNHKMDLYQGMFIEGKRSGFGISFNDDGIYFGQVDENFPCGKGTLYTVTGDTIEGSFERITKEDAAIPSALGENPYLRGLPHGQCTICFADGSFYEGNVKDGIIDGNGIYINALGERMEGLFHNGVLHGPGKMLTVTGEILEGHFVHGELHGYGSFVSPSHQYEGMFDHGEKSGKGQERISMNVMSRMQTNNNNNDNSDMTVENLKRRRRVQSIFEGFFQNDQKIGHGNANLFETSKKGNKTQIVQEVNDFNQQGPWLEHRIRVSKPLSRSIPSRCYQYQILNALTNYSLQKTQKFTNIKNELYHSDRALRKKIIDKKKDIFQKQLQKLVTRVLKPHVVRRKRGIQHCPPTMKSKKPETYFGFRTVNTAPDSIKRAEVKPGLEVGVKLLSLESSNIVQAFDSVNDAITAMGLNIPQQSHISDAVKTTMKEIETKWKLINIDRLKASLKDRSS